VAANQEELGNAEHEIQILFLERTHLRERESFSTAFERNFFGHDEVA
jgi:hypothetical protein